MKNLTEFIKEGYFNDKSLSWERIGDCLYFAEALGINVKKESEKVFEALAQVYGLDKLEHHYKQDWSDVNDRKDKIIMGAKEMLKHWKK